MTNKPGYHLAEIPKGVLGEVSKIVEEAAELADANAQGSLVMCLVEAADLYGALEAYLEKHHPEIGMSDLAIFSHITKRAFQNGHR